MVDCRGSTTVNQTVSSHIDIATLMVIAKKLFVSLRKRFLETIYALFRSHIETLAANRHICLVSFLRTCKKIIRTYLFISIQLTNRRNVTSQFIRTALHTNPYDRVPTALPPGASQRLLKRGTNNRTHINLTRGAFF